MNEISWRNKDRVVVWTMDAETAREVASVLEMRREIYPSPDAARLRRAISHLERSVGVVDVDGPTSLDVPRERLKEGVVPYCNGHGHEPMTFDSDGQLLDHVDTYHPELAAEAREAVAQKARP